MIDFRYENYSISLSHLSLVKVEGGDAKNFFQGQITTDVADHFNKLKISCRLDRQGRIKSYFYLLGISENKYYLFCKAKDEKLLIEDFEKYVIMEDIAFSSTDHNFYFFSGAKAKSSFQAEFFGEEGFIAEGVNQNEFPLLGSDKQKELFFKSAMAEVDKSVLEEKLLVNSTLVEMSYDNDKPCFLGKEAVSKVYNRKGASLYPVFIEEFKEVQDDSEKVVQGKILDQRGPLYIFLLKREDRLNSEIVRLESKNKEIHGKIRLFPYFKDGSRKEKSKQLYLCGVNEMNKGNSNLCEEYFRKSLFFDENNLDALESIGVLKGRKGEFKEGIKFMDMLLERDSQSVMAHTNKSLFYMKLGQIEKAEEEKALASLKGMQSEGEEQGSMKRELEEREKLLKRMKMFEKVLELDPEDDFANFSAGEISFKLKMFNEARKYLQKAIALNTKNPKAYYILGQVSENFQDGQGSEELFNEGIKLALASGDTNLASEIKSRLVNL